MAKVTKKTATKKTAPAKKTYTNPYKVGCGLARAYDVFMTEGADAARKKGVEEIGLNPTTLKIWVPLWEQGILKRSSDKPRKAPEEKKSTAPKPTGKPMPLDEYKAGVRDKVLKKTYADIKEARRVVFGAGWKFGEVLFAKNKKGRYTVSLKEAA